MATKKKRKRLPTGVETEVLTRSRRRCCLCFGLSRDTSLKSGQIAHLNHDSTDDSIKNLVFLCLPHHDSYDSQTSQSKNYTLAEVRKLREELYIQVEAVWSKPVTFGVPSPDLEGRYFFDRRSRNAEIQVSCVSGDVYHLEGIAFSGIGKSGGPNIGELSCDVRILGGRATYAGADGSYELELTFLPGHLVATERGVSDTFGLGVSFEGSYSRAA